MSGVVTLKHIMSHPWTVIHGFGLVVFLRALYHGARGDKTTFLDLLK